MVTAEFRLEVEALRVFYGRLFDTPRGLEQGALRCSR